MTTFPQKVINFPQKITNYPQLVNNFSQMNFTPKYVDLRALSSIVPSRIYALFVLKSTSVPKFGGGGGGQANFGNAKIVTAPVLAIHPSPTPNETHSRVKPILRAPVTETPP